MRFALLHSPLMGPSTWTPVAIELARRGIEVMQPAIPKRAEMTAPLYTSLGEAVARQFLGRGPVVLVVHSGAGGLASSVVAAATNGQIKAVLYVDAILPHPGRTWFETTSVALGANLKTKVIDGMIPAWDQWFPSGTLEGLMPEAALRAEVVSELMPTPLVWFEEAAPQVDLPSDMGLGFLRLSKAYEREADEAGRLGWPTLRRDLQHLAMATHPKDVTEAMLELMRLVGLRAA